jgi:anti-anti-sigma factor
MPKRFRVVIDRLGDLPLLHLSGDMIFGQALSELHEEIATLAAAGHARLVLDLTEVDSADSSGIGALLGAKRTAGEITGTVVLLRPSSRLRSALDAIRATSMFVVVYDEADLLRSL